MDNNKFEQWFNRRFDRGTIKIAPLCHVDVRILKEAFRNCWYSAILSEKETERENNYSDTEIWLERKLRELL